jgi:hypothetical protein
MVLLVVACGSDTVEPSVLFEGEDCSSSDPEKWPTSGPLDIEVTNNTETLAAVVMGSYHDGFGHEDLVAYNTDVSTRPDFIDALEILQVASESTSNLGFDHGPGTYFMVCMPDTNTMVVLGDVTMDG